MQTPRFKKLWQAQVQSRSVRLERTCRKKRTNIRRSLKRKWAVSLSTLRLIHSFWRFEKSWFHRWSWKRNLLINSSANWRLQSLKKKRTSNGLNYYSLKSSASSRPALLKSQTSASKQIKCRRLKLYLAKSLWTVRAISTALWKSSSPTMTTMKLRDRWKNWYKQTTSWWSRTRH